MKKLNSKEQINKSKKENKISKDKFIENKKIILKLSKILILIYVIGLILGISYAIYNYTHTGNNFSIIAGDIYLKYANGSTKNIFITPSDTYNENDYFEFTITGKNTSNKDIIYDISLNHGDNLNSPFIRIADRFLNFRLVTIENNEEIEIFEDDSYDEINNTRIHVGRINGETNQEVSVVYRLYIWVDGVIVGNVNQDYTQEQWANVYANIKVDVTGDFTNKTTEDRVKVTFDANRGSVNIPSKTFIYGNTYGKLPTPTRDGYTFLGWILNILPDEYQEVEYIETNGTQYINTEVFGNNSNLSFDIEYSWNSLPATGAYAYIFGSYSSEQDNSTRILQYGPSTTYYNNNSKAGGGTGIYNATRYNDVIYHDILSANNGSKFTYTTNDISQSKNYVAGNTVSKNTNLFSSSSGNSRANAKLYYFKIYNNDSLLKNFIPCYRKNDGVVGLYDTVGRTFYTSNGTDPLNKGNNVSNYNIILSTTKVTIRESHTLHALWQKNPIVTFDPNGGTVNINSKSIIYDKTYGDLPTPKRNGYTFVTWSKKNNNNNINISEYTPVEYISSTGTQYIDTEVSGNNSNLSLDIEYSWNSLPETGVYAYIFGSYNSEQDNTTRIIQYGDSISYFNINSKATGGSGVYNATRYTNVIYHDTLSANNGNEFTYTTNNVNQSKSYVAGNDVPKNIYLFSKTGGNTKADIKLYYFKIYDTGVLIRDYVPCYRKSDGVVGLYDSVSGTFYTNQGTGEFIKGDNIYVTSNTIVTDPNDHTLYAIWQQN